VLALLQGANEETTVMPVRKINDIKVWNMGTQYLSGKDGEYDAETSQLWVKQEGSEKLNGGPVEGTVYSITFTGSGSNPPSLKFKGRFAGVGYEFQKA
jgi:hypothetical protein